MQLQMKLFSKITMAATVALPLLFVSGVHRTGENVITLLKALTLSEKISLLHGKNGIYIGNVGGIDRLKIPKLLMHDGPQVTITFLSVICPQLI